MTQNKILQAIEALQRHDRHGAVSLLKDELRNGAPTGERWGAVSRLAVQIGEIEIALVAARRHSRTEPITLERLLQYWSELTTHGRADDAQAEIERLPADVRRHPGVLHFEGTLAGQDGDFDRALALYRQGIHAAPLAPQSWFALAMIKHFSVGDPDLDAMEAQLPAVLKADPDTSARFLYGLAKAWGDTGAHDKAFTYYERGAAIRKQTEKWDPQALENFADGLIRDFTGKAMNSLKPVEVSPRKALFVNGLPRSGTTLAEQILVSHSQVEEGAEINLVRAALIPAGDRSLAQALAYQERVTSEDPWGVLASDYFDMLRQRFRTDQLVVDKTLGQSHFMGLLMHMLPEARVIWMRRNPDDVALSCFRNYFSSKLPWSWSLEDIGRFMRIEDRLFDHWRELFGDRILVVPYEELVHDPNAWIGRMLDHAGLSYEPQVREFHKTERSVRTASVQQVRGPISTARIGQAEAYAAQLKPFRAIYEG